MPGLDGVGVCRDIRTFSAVPTTMPTAGVDELDHPLGLNTGADRRDASHRTRDSPVENLRHKMAAADPDVTSLGSA